MRLIMAYGLILCQIERCYGTIKLLESRSWDRSIFLCWQASFTFCEFRKERCLNYAYE